MASEKTVADDDIRALAYRMWEDDGRPEGSADMYWFKALDELRGAGSEQQTGALADSQLADAAALARKV